MRTHRPLSPPAIYYLLPHQSLQEKQAREGQTIVITRKRNESYTIKVVSRAEPAEQTELDAHDPLKKAIGEFVGPRRVVRT